MLLAQNCCWGEKGNLFSIQGRLVRKREFALSKKTLVRTKSRPRDDALPLWPRVRQGAINFFGCSPMTAVTIGRCALALVDRCVSRLGRWRRCAITTAVDIMLWLVGEVDDLEGDRSFALGASRLQSATAQLVGGLR